MTNRSCRVCRAPLRARKSAKAGRPAQYCGPTCRKTAELEVRRVGSRLAKLEDRLSELRISLDGGDYGSRREASEKRRLNVQVQAVSAEVARQEERLRALLGAAEEVVNAEDESHTSGPPDPADP